MTVNRLLKGFEVELFTGTASAEHVGIASVAADELSDFVKEPDQRNLEYITLPERKYEYLKNALLIPRKRLREWLKTKNLTILPGSTLSLGDSGIFLRSDPSNSYHSLIERQYGSNVVTTSVHINLGIDNLPLLFSALRLVRCEAAIFLALSASSPFLDGALTGNHSQRWIQFPLTPQEVPIFLDHSHYVVWVEEQLRQKNMWNERHLWTSVRPNGPSRPYKVDRLELRICDLVTDCDLLLAITALLELRVLSLVTNVNELDPLEVSSLTVSELAHLSKLNDISAAKLSLDAVLHHWKNGEKIYCREWIDQLISEVTPLAESQGMLPLLNPIKKVLLHGNQSMRWINACSHGESIDSVLKDSIQAIENEEKACNQSGSFLG